jgi:predicted RNase H-like HicB family nuclease
MIRGVDTMRISVLIEPVPGNGYRAMGSEPLGLVAEGATRDVALQRLREMIDE